VQRGARVTVPAPVPQEREGTFYRALSATRLLGQIAAPMSVPTARTIHLPDLAATERLAAAVAALAHPGDAILLEGPLGAGKTAFARAFLRATSDDPALEVPSPTFTLVQSYATPRGMIHHFDLWRLNGPDALAELDWEEARDDIVLVEWPDRLGPLRPADGLTVALRPADPSPGARQAALSGWPDRIGGLA
jgi:tRNA threonylcarbamoyladenosine biosynthesis protein TsaE